MSELVEVKVPDIGDFDAVDVIEVLVAVGDQVAEDDSLISLESDKATMDIPAPRAGTVQEIKVSTGDQVSEGTVILMLEPSSEDQGGDEKAEQEADEPAPAEPDDEPASEPEPDEDTEPESEPAPEPVKKAPPAETPSRSRKVDETSFAQAHASPAVRRFARELGADLGRVKGSGRKGRILKEDVQAWVKAQLQAGAGRSDSAGGSLGGLDLAPAPEVDFEKYGPVETEPLTKIQKLTGANLHRSWVTIPHVTQFDEADITELEAFRKSMKAEAEQRGVKLTPLPFQILAVVAALKEFPRFNASLSADGENLVMKGYVHIGIAVDTPRGLVVPVIRDADQKGLFQLAEELSDLASRARDRKLSPDDMGGGSFTISSLGGIGGTAFTPIVNPPEVAILGVSKAAMKPVWNDETSEFEPRLMLPLSLSYDHRVIDGVAGARFTSYLAQVLGDIRRLLL
jgi:pyruvate dehydrogenase E2 component (dihydrolipoamide acetyltransferase)